MIATADDTAPSALMPGYDADACRRLMRGGSKTFFAASMLLPPRVRAPASALYAFCREADDAIDLGEDAAAAAALLRRRLDAVYAGRPGEDNVDRALAQVVHRFAIPRALFDALVEGFVWDARGRRYATLDELQDYGARVAGTVGAMMCLVMGNRSPAALARACELGVAMQLTNIARDVGEDARAGRLYLPLDGFAQAGVDADAWLRSPVFDAALASMIRRLLAAADAAYARAEAGIAALPRDCRPAIQAARLVYAEIGHELARRGGDSINQRTVVSPHRKLSLLARAATAVWRVFPAEALRRPPLPAVQFLVDAAADDGMAAHRPSFVVPRRSLGERMDWMGDLLVRLSERERAPRSGR